jgi:hypothetical protein
LDRGNKIIIAATRLESSNISQTSKREENGKENGAMTPLKAPNPHHDDPHSVTAPTTFLLPVFIIYLFNS